MSPYNSTFSKPGKPLPKRSAKRVIEDREFAKVRAFVMERDGWECQLQTRLARHGGELIYFAHGCRGPLDPHHVITVARDVTRRLDPDNLVILCRSAHDWVHAHPFEAEMVGLLKSAPLLSPPAQPGPKVTPYYQDDTVTIYHGDCREMTFPTFWHDCAVVTDPPYGMAWDGRVRRGPNGTGATAPSRNWGRTIAGDDEPFDPSPLLGFDEVLLWGFNHFPQHLGRGTALVWIKRYEDGFATFLSDAEIAWLNKGHGVYCRRDTSLQGEERLHPTQKPLGIMAWCLTFINAPTILNPFCGSGTTLRAAKDAGRRAIGIEIEERYCEIAAKRCAQEVLAL